jgi:glycosyltransferase involved in cell wall biosynthesis
VALAPEGITTSAEPTALSDGEVEPGMQEAPAPPSLQQEPDGLPSVSVIITACASQQALEHCLRSILRSEYDDFEVIVVDNGPPSSETARMLVRQFPGELRLRYVEAPWSSTSCARNTGLARAEAEIVAFTDDDVLVDRLWLRTSVEALLSDEGIVCVTGYCAPRDLDGEIRFLPERLGDGVRRTIHRLPDCRKENPLLLYTAGGLGPGAGPVMLTEVAREVGGFDPALGPATPACGGEHIDLLVRLLQSGYALSYEPSAIVWREHPVHAGRRRRQIYHHGVGLGAIIGKRLIAGPQRRDWLRAIPAALRYTRDPAPPADLDEPSSYPRHLKWLMRLGMLIGPIAYLVSALIARTRRLLGKQPSGPRPLRIVQRMVVGGETINVVWFGQAQSPRVRLSWRRADDQDATGSSEDLVAALTIIGSARPAATRSGKLRISAVVPARNAESWIESCLRSIRANHPAEVILVDGGSTDRTVELARPWVDRVIDDGGTGVAAARMMGVASATQPWIALVDADVVLPPTALQDLDQERSARHLVALQAGLHSVGEGDYWSQSLADHHNRGQSKQWFGVCASLIARDLLLAHPLDADLRSGEDIDLRIRLTRAGFPVGVSETMIGQHRFAHGFSFAGKQWLADGAGLGRMVRKHGRAALVSAMIPFAAAGLGLVRGVRDTLRPWPYFVGFAIGNYIGLWRGLVDRSVPASAPGRRLLVAGMVVWLLALPVGLALVAAALALLMLKLGHAAYEGRLLLVTLGIVAVAIPFEVGRGPGNGRFSAIARQVAPFTAWAMLLALILSAVRLAKVVGL